MVDSNDPYFLTGGPAVFHILNFKGHHHERSICKTIFSGLSEIDKLYLVKVMATALFPTVCYAFCDTYIDFQWSANTGNSIF
jgi:hypothetical protein